MKAKDFKRMVLFMANRWDEQRASEIFGSVMGEHYWNKWCGVSERTGSPDIATMRLFYEMDEDYMQVLCDYVDKFYER